MTKLELELTFELLDKIIDKYIDEREGQDRQSYYKEIYGNDIEAMREEIKGLIMKICEVDK